MCGCEHQAGAVVFVVLLFMFFPVVIFDARVPPLTDPPLQVVEGSEVIDLIEAAGADNMDGKPTVSVVIASCGVLA